jgi:hypothetical protein
MNDRGKWIAASGMIAGVAGLLASSAVSAAADKRGLFDFVLLDDAAAQRPWPKSGSPGEAWPSGDLVLAKNGAGGTRAKCGFAPAERRAPRLRRCPCSAGIFSLTGQCPAANSRRLLPIRYIVAAAKQVRSAPVGRGGDLWGMHFSPESPSRRFWPVQLWRRTCL